MELGPRFLPGTRGHQGWGDPVRPWEKAEGAESGA